jgi:hypothetical protein
MPTSHWGESRKAVFSEVKSLEPRVSTHLRNIINRRISRDNVFRQMGLNR